LTKKGLYLIIGGKVASPGFLNALLDMTKLPFMQVNILVQGLVDYGTEVLTESPGYLIQSGAFLGVGEERYA
jgi:hypothetical protein